MIYKLELKSSHDVVDTIDVSNVDSIFQGKPTDPDILTVVMKDGKKLYCDEVCPMQESVSDDLEMAAKNHAVERFRTTRNGFLADKCKWSFIAGAKWKEQQMMSRAVDFTIVDNNDVSTEISTFPYVSLGREGDEVKLIVIKQE